MARLPRVSPLATSLPAIVAVQAAEKSCGWRASLIKTICFSIFCPDPKWWSLEVYGPVGPAIQARVGPLISLRESCIHDHVRSPPDNPAVRQLRHVLTR